MKNLRKCILALETEREFHTPDVFFRKCNRKLYTAEKNVSKVTRTTHHFGGNLGDVAGDGLAGPAIVGHLEFHRVTDLEVLNIPLKLGEVEEEASLTVAALDESVRMLRRNTQS